MHCLKICLMLAFASSVFAKGVNDSANAITISLGTEPPTLDTSLTEDGTSNFVLGTIHESLVRIDSRGRIVPGLAETWTLSDTGAVFHLRRNARWSDGIPITTHDFVYAWRRLVDPATGASGSTFMAFVLKNATSIIRGEMDKETLGVKALDDFTLEVTTSRYIPFLLQALSGVPYAPLREEFVIEQGRQFAADHDKMLFSGPFTLSSWVHGASLSFKKNIHYWNQAKVNLNNIDVGYITSDKRALLNLYRANEIATLDLNGSVLDDAIKNGFRIRKKPNNCSSMVTLNHREGRPTSNKHLRKALQYAFDANVYTNRIIALPGTLPSYSVFTRNILAEGQPFVERFPVALNAPDLQKAKNHLKLAIAELGKVPTLVLLSRENAEKRDEYIQASFKTALNLDIKIDRQSFKQAIDRLIKGEFDLAFSGFCTGTMDDPFMAVVNYTTSHPFNDGRFTNSRYDELYEHTTNTKDQGSRMKAFSEMQDILIEEAVVIPTHESADIYVQDKLVQRLYYGANRDFSWALIRR